MVYRTTGAPNPPLGGFFQTLCPWPGNPSPSPSQVVAVDWDPYTQQAFVLTVAPNGPGFGEVWRTDLATYTIRTPIVPPANPQCNLTQPMRFFDLAVYRTPQNTTLVAVAMNTFLGLGNTANVDVYDPVSGASVISPLVGPHCNLNPTYRRIDAGFVQNIQTTSPLPPFVPGFYVTLLEAFSPSTPTYSVRMLSIPPTSNIWANIVDLTWGCSTGGPEILRPLSVSINREGPILCSGPPLSEIVIGGVQECGASAPGHSYMHQLTNGSFASYALRHATFSPGFNQMATDVVITAGNPFAPAPMYVIQYSTGTCNNPAGSFWWFERDCNTGNPVALPSLPWTNVQPVDVAAIR